MGINSRNISDLHPTLERACYEFIRRMDDNGFSHVGISSTYRDNVYQEHLFSKGRTRPGNIVTNARGGQSVHNYRLAFDFFQNIRGKEWNDNSFWNTGGNIWREMGGVWGGDWKHFVDRPHCEYTSGLSIKNLQNGNTLPFNAIMIWETTSYRDNQNLNFNYEQTQEKHPLSEKNIQAMFSIGLINSPNYWRNVSVKWLDHLLDRALTPNTLCHKPIHKIDSIETAIKILNMSGIIESPEYWKNLIITNKVPYLDDLIINIANRSNYILNYTF